MTQSKILFIFLVIFFIFSDLVHAQTQNVLQFPANTPTGEVTGGYFNRYFENILKNGFINNIAPHHLGAHVCPAGKAIVGFYYPSTNPYLDIKTGSPICANVNALAIWFTGSMIGSGWFLPVYSSTGTWLTNSLISQVIGNRNTRNQLIVDADINVGTPTDAYTMTSTPEMGKKIIFWGTSSNTDDISLYRYNPGRDISTLRMIIGDNPSGGDKFEIGYNKNFNFYPRFTFVSSWKMGIEQENPQANLHISGSLILQNGTQWDKKLLVSDRNGLATWKNFSDILWENNAPISASSLSGKLKGIDTFVPMWSSGGTLFEKTLLKQQSGALVFADKESGASFYLVGKTTQGEPGLRLHYNNDRSSPAFDVWVLDFRGKLFSIRGKARNQLWDMDDARSYHFNILSDGNVGIGTTDPSTKLEVDGNISLGKLQNQRSRGNESGSRLFFEGASHNFDPIYMYRYNNGIEHSELRMAIGDDWQENSDRVDSFKIGTTAYADKLRDSNLFNTKFTFTSHGRLGIGKESPEKKLDVDGEIRSNNTVWANRFCFNQTGECTTTFQQNYANNNEFQLADTREIAYQDNKFSVRYTDNSKPMYIKLTQQMLETIGMEDEKTTNWVTIAYSSLEAHDNGRNRHRQLWVDGGIVLFYHYRGKDRVEWNGIRYMYPKDDPNWVLRSCYYTDENGVQNRYNDNYEFCAWAGNSNGRTITRVISCEKGKRYCGAVSMEMRLTTSDKYGWNGRFDGVECQNANIPYAPILRVSAYDTLELKRLFATPYSAPPSVYDPIKCGVAIMGSAIQIRFKMSPLSRMYWPLAWEQSLMELVKMTDKGEVPPLVLSINKVGLMYMNN